MLVLIALQRIYFHGVKIFIGHWKYSYFVESVFEEIIFLGEGRFHDFHAFQGFQAGVGRAQKANMESVEKWSSWTPKAGSKGRVQK